MSQCCGKGGGGDCCGKGGGGMRTCFDYRSESDVSDNTLGANDFQSTEVDVLHNNFFCPHPSLILWFDDFPASWVPPLIF